MRNGHICWTSRKSGDISEIESQTSWRAGASLVPSPVTATTSPPLRNACTSKSLSLGEDLPMTYMPWYNKLIIHGITMMQLHLWSSKFHSIQISNIFFATCSLSFSDNWRNAFPSIKLTNSCSIGSYVFRYISVYFFYLLLPGIMNCAFTFQNFSWPW